MNDRVDTTHRFDREFKKLDRYTQKMLKNWIEKHLVDSDNPRAMGEPLSAGRKGQWRYRIGDYRLLCSIEDDKLLILALSVSHRREIYRNIDRS